MCPPPTGIPARRKSRSRSSSKRRLRRQRDHTEERRNGETETERSGMATDGPKPFDGPPKAARAKRRSQKQATRETRSGLFVGSVASRVATCFAGRRVERSYAGRRWPISVRLRSFVAPC